jgi:hypothetical protein
MRGDSKRCERDHCEHDATQLRPGRNRPPAVGLDEHRSSSDQISLLGARGARVSGAGARLGWDVLTAALDFQYVTVTDSFDPRVTFRRAEGLIADGDVLVTYFGADVGVEVVVERAACPRER